MICYPKFFRIDEMIPKEVMDGYNGDKANLWLLFDQRVLWTIDKLRVRYGKMVMNTYPWGGDSHYRGFRPWTSTVGAYLSQHKFGRAADLVPVNVTSEDIRQDIIANPDLDEFKFIRCIENGVSWFHFDVRNWIGNTLFIDP